MENVRINVALVNWKLCKDFPGELNQTEETIVCERPVQGRRVRLMMLDVGAVLNLSEIEVHGSLFYRPESFAAAT